MTVPVGPSFFNDVYNVVFTLTGNNSMSSSSAGAIHIYSVASISFDRSETVLEGGDNVNLRPVGAHIVGIRDTVTIETMDGNAIENLMFSNGQGQLTFNWRADAHYSIGANQLPDQTVQISEVFINKKSLKQPSKQHGTFSISGFCMSATGGDAQEVIAFSTTSSPQSDSAN